MNARRIRPKALKWWDRNFLILEHIVPLALVSAGVVLTYTRGWQHVIIGAIGADRSGLYQAVAAVAGSLLGFSIAAVAIVIGFAQSPQLAVLRRSSHYPLLWRVFQSGIRWLGIATVATIVALVIDRPEAPRLAAAFIVLYVALVASARVARTIWVLERTIAILIANRGEPE